MHSYFTHNLLNLNNIKIKHIEYLSDCINFHIYTSHKTVNCPCCNSLISKVHDYRIQIIKDLPIHFKHVFLVLRKRRYVCKSCNKRFYEDLDFLPKFFRMTSRLFQYIIHALKSNSDMNSIAKSVNLSSPTVARALNCFAPIVTSFPEVLSIDEFKGDSDNNKFHCILADPNNHSVIDILPSRKQSNLCDYFKAFPQSVRDNVKYFVMDMWQPFYDIAFSYFRNAKIIADKFHYCRYVLNALDSIRIRIQSNLPKDQVKFFKHSKKLLLAHSYNLKDSSNEKVSFLLNNYHDDLRQGYNLKESFFRILKEQDPDKAKNDFSHWIINSENSYIPEFISCSNTFRNWFTCICNSFYVPYTNGPIEGYNNKIKVIKRTAYGFRNFNNFRKRILLAFSK